MAEKSLGYVELEWECPNCHNRNPGPARTCASCGAPQPKDVAFQQAPEEQLITDQAKIATAQAGPDIHCAYCGARNPATAKTCKQCGSALAEGTARESGKVLGGLKDKPAPEVKCPSCGAMNPGAALKCSKCGAQLIAPQEAPPLPPTGVRPRYLGLIIAAAVLGLIGIFALVMVLGSRTTESVGQVSDVTWRRAIAIEALVPVTRETWRDELPAGADAGRCDRRVRSVQDHPAPGAREVCGTPYVIDTGTGYGQVKQDCRYEISDDWCSYKAMAWVAAPPLVLEGADLNPRWPDAALAQNQRAGGRTENYAVVFKANDKMYTYAPRGLEEFVRFAPGSRWKLATSALGGVNVTGPAQ